jgi:hypothetical protein
LALRDAEDFTSICFALEELGCRLKEYKASGLGCYEKQFQTLAASGGMDEARFEVLLHHVRMARNDAARQGISARNAAKRTIRLGVYIEGIIMTQLKLVGDVMSGGLPLAQPHHTLSFLRETMLGNSFSFLPYPVSSEYRLISDGYIAQLLESAEYSRDKFFITTVSQLDPRSIGQLEKAVVLKNIDLLKNVIDENSVYPAVVEADGGRAVGIITAFNLL